MPPTIRRTRLAPSPTGALHLGNARTFLINWALARQQGWKVILRIDDLDGPRVKADAARQAIEDLKWLGMDWDEGPVYQSEALSPYSDALRLLYEAGEIYPCCCTRSQIEAASAPQEGVHELRYPGTCRTSDAASEPPVLEPGDACWRVRMPSGTRTFVDEFVGPQSQDVQQQVGDFQVTTKLGLPSYQLATVVDDEAAGITEVVRGDDLIDSTHRQAFLRQRLGYAQEIRYWHLPIVVGEDGRRLAKRHGDSRIRYYREMGATPERLLGLLQEWCGGGARVPVTTNGFLDNFQLQKVPHSRITMTAEDHAWLTQ